MFKAKGKRVVANDHMSMAHVMAKALIENNSTRLSVSKAASLMAPNRQSDKFVSTTFSDIYFSKEENELIDNIRANIKQLNSEYEIAIAKSALIRACIKKRPRGVFTYIGNRYDDGRRDLRISLQQHFMDSVEALNQAVFDNGKTNVAKNVDAMDLKCDRESLIYIDPPYFTPKSDSDYVRRYHFVEGIARDWKGVDIQVGTKTKKFKGYPTPFSTEAGATMAFGELFARFSKNILVVSYSSNSLPSLPQMIALLRRFKGNVEVFPVKYKYSFGNQKRNVAANRNVVTEYIFIAY
jgi:DNA adenine methylase